MAEAEKIIHQLKSATDRFSGMSEDEALRELMRYLRIPSSELESVMTDLFKLDISLRGPKGNDGLLKQVSDLLAEAESIRSNLEAADYNRVIAALKKYNEGYSLLVKRHNQLNERYSALELRVTELERGKGVEEEGVEEEEGFLGLFKRGDIAIAMISGALIAGTFIGLTAGIMRLS